MKITNIALSVIALSVLFLILAVGTGVMAMQDPGDTAVAKTGYDLNFQPQKEGPQWTNNTPLHGAVLAGVPINVVVDFYYDRGPGSKISIMKDGKEYGIGETTIDPNKLAMRRDMDPDAPDGIYTVRYTACLPEGEGGCGDGKFQFAIDRSKAGEFTDMRGMKEVTIDMKDIEFKPRRVIVDKGTKVTWVNKDDVIHYVNTDPHPEHTYYRVMNSKALNKGDTFSLTFDKPGIYPYHCSAHTGMTATLLVE